MKKIVFLGFLGLFLFLVLFGFSIRYPAVAVLGYHGFTLDVNHEDPLIMNVKHFEEQLQYLSKHGYHTLTLDEFYEYKQNKRKIPVKSVLITMDDGYQSNYDLAFPLLKKYDMNAVVFYIGANVEEKYPSYMSLETVQRIKKEYPNIEIASHSYSLHEKGAVERGKDYLKDDFERMKSVISTKYFAYPYGDYNQDIIEVLKEENYRMAFTFGPSRNHRKASFLDSNYKIPRLNISNDMPLWKFALRLHMPF